MKKAMAQNGHKHVLQMGFNKTVWHARWIFRRLIERLSPRVLHVSPTHSHKHQALSWMSQEVSKRLGSVGYNPS